MTQNGLTLILLFFPLPEVVKSRGIDLFSEHIFDGCIRDDISVQESEAKSQQSKRRKKKTKVMTKQCSRLRKNQ